MLKKIVFLLLYFIYLSAYELPQMNLKSSNVPEIVLFNATSVIVENKSSYLLKWKTSNASEVKITYIGKVELSGEMIITAEEYNRGPITLKAFGKENSLVDSLIINDLKSDLPPPIKFSKPKREEGFQPFYEDPSLYRGDIRRPYPMRRRHY